jgi:uncharacterized protein YfaA (DUF2138 family)
VGNKHTKPFSVEIKESDIETIDALIEHITKTESVSQLSKDVLRRELMVRKVVEDFMNRHKEIEKCVIITTHKTKTFCMEIHLGFISEINGVSYSYE